MPRQVNQREQTKDEISVRRAAWLDRRFSRAVVKGWRQRLSGRMERQTDGGGDEAPVCPPAAARVNYKLFVVVVSDVWSDETVGRATCFKSNYDVQPCLHLICLRWWIDLSALITVVQAIGGGAHEWLRLSRRSRRSSSLSSRHHSMLLASSLRI